MRGSISLGAILALLAFLGMAAAPAGAEITVDGTGFWASTSSPVIGTFDASGSDKLVVIATGEHGFNQTANGQINTITYDGVELIKLVDRNPIKAVADDPETPEDETVLVDDTANDIWYLDNPGSSTGLIEVNATTRGCVTVIALSGTAEGAGNWVIGERDTSSANLTTSADSIVIASYGMGGSGNTARVTNVDWDGDVEVSAQENGNVWDGHVTGYTNGVAEGDDIYSFTDTNSPGADGRTGAHVILAEFLTADTSVPGDANGDGIVDAADYILVKQNMGLAVGVTGEEGDLDSDGTVDWDDLQLLIGGMSGATQSSVPEPVSLLIMAAGLPVLLRRRRLVTA